MIYRYYQERFVKKSFDALKLHQGVLGVGATGCGKTVMLSGVANQFDRVLVLQHRTELLEQNSKTFGWVNPDLPYGLVDSKRDNWLENYTFGMTQTIARRLEKVPAYDLIVVDEAHHTAANQHEEIIDAVRDKNPDAKLFGVTATPERADKKDLSKNCVTYWLNKLQNIKTKTNYFLTLNPITPIEHTKIIKKVYFTHPFYDLESIKAQKDLVKLQGKNNSWFCGSYFGYGFHEDGIKSSINIVNQV